MLVRERDTAAAYHPVMDRNHHGEPDGSDEPSDFVDREEEGLDEDSEDPGDDVGTV